MAMSGGRGAEKLGRRRRRRSDRHGLAPRDPEKMFEWLEHA
jgi:hypothetical protein